MNSEVERNETLNVRIKSVSLSPSDDEALVAFEMYARTQTPVGSRIEIGEDPKAVLTQVVRRRTKHGSDATDYDAIVKDAAEDMMQSIERVRDDLQTICSDAARVSEAGAS